MDVRVDGICLWLGQSATTKQTAWTVGSFLDFVGTAMLHGAALPNTCAGRLFHLSSFFTSELGPLD